MPFTWFSTWVSFARAERSAESSSSSQPWSVTKFLEKAASSGNEGMPEVLLGHNATVIVRLAASFAEVVSCLQACELLQPAAELT